MRTFRSVHNYIATPSLIVMKSPISFRLNSALPERIALANVCPSVASPPIVMPTTSTASHSRRLLMGYSPRSFRTKLPKTSKAIDCRALGFPAPSLPSSYPRKEIHMRWSARKFVLMGFVVGLAASGGVILWTDEQSHIVARPAPPAAAPATPETSQELTTIVADVARWQSEMKSELTTLRAQLASVDHDQSATDQQLDQIADKIRRVGLEKTASTVGEKDAEAAPLTPEQEQERAAARNQAELTLMEGTLRAETSDLAWANTAQLALQT